VTNEILDRSDVVRQLLGKREAQAHQPRDSLAQCAVEPLDRVGVTGAFGADLVLGGRDDALIRLPVIGREGCLLTVHRRETLPQLAGAMGSDQKVTLGLWKRGATRV